MKPGELVKGYIKMMRVNRPIPWIGMHILNLYRHLFKSLDVHCLVVEDRIYRDAMLRAFRTHRTRSG